DLHRPWRRHGAHIMTTHEDLLDIAAHHLVQNYKQQPVVLARGEGVELWDVRGQRYLDMTAGIAVCCLGHAHPNLPPAIALQAGPPPPPPHPSLLPEQTPPPRPPPRPPPP